ncbi:disease resistance protein RUN1-like [Eucalyptus grandis]|uniref:disease resistance protein RUN1-like n=1 Tax=Eucalyptus grandis TaxID=71139 RepID=UPI00192EB420|nr:disease resistance protein RUN1-like [Eucalyptus grandis]
MEKGQSLSKANKAMLVAEEKESTEGASSPSSFLPKPTKGGSSRYDVFLSFNSSDTRKEFIDHLYHGLGTAGICVFRDCNSIRIGEEFSPVFLDAITCSKISIPIISGHYASSKWCLRELIHIMDCKKSNSHIVLPIFYKVDPSDVRHLKRNFGEAFHSHKHCFDEKDIEEGRQTLKDVSNLHGWKSDEFASGHEGELIERVVETVLGELRKDFPLLVPEELVGLDDQLKKIMSYMDSPYAIARMLGIYGRGGIGKTTLAKCIYNQLSNKFDHVCILPDIRETTARHGIEYLQSRLIFEILQEKNAVSTVDLGINLIKSRFTRKKVLILLDDIDQKDHLDALARERNWFASGSIIIVTTRNKAVLDQSEFEVDYEHEMSMMNEVHSFILFNRHAFRTEHPSSDFAIISRQIISILGGLPLALKVIGSYLYKKTNPKVWDDMLRQLKNQAYEDVQNILKISYDALEYEHKEIFLDIACFFIDKKIEFAMYMWDDYKFYASQGIEELNLRCLIKIEDDGKLSMHDQLRDLGRSIFHKGQSLMKHNGLWVDEEAFKGLMEKKRTAMIETNRCDGFLVYPFLDCGAAEQLQARTNWQFRMSQRLRFLRLGDTTASEDLNEFLSQVRWLHWLHIELNPSFPTNDLHLPKLKVLQLSYSSITDD